MTSALPQAEPDPTLAAFVVERPDWPGALVACAVGAFEYRLGLDDDPQLVDAAIRLGYRGVALMRDGQPPASVPVITSLDELLPIVAGTV